MKVKNCSITTPLFAQFSAYLTSKIQALNVNGTPSKPRPFTGVVIQRSIIGRSPLPLYIDDIFHIIKHDIPSPVCRRLKLCKGFTFLNTMPSYSMPKVIYLNHEAPLGQWNSGLRKAAYSRTNEIFLQEALKILTKTFLPSHKQRPEFALPRLKL